MNYELINDIVQWDVHNWHKALKFWDDHVDLTKYSTVLGVGEREGGLSLWMAKKGLKVTCTDLRGITEKGNALHRKYSVEDHIECMNADLLNLPFANESFDIVMFKSVLGALPNETSRIKAIQEIHRVLKQGGVLIFAENSKASVLHEVSRKLFRSKKYFWYYFKNKDLKLFKEFKKVTFSGVGFWGAFGQTEKWRKWLGKFDDLFCKIVPKRFRYIYSVIAFK